MQEAQLQPEQQHCLAEMPLGPQGPHFGGWQVLVPHHVTEGSEASCIVQMRINTEELHAEQDKHSC